MNRLYYILITTLILLPLFSVLEKAESFPVKNLNLLSDSQIWKTVNSAKLNKTQSYYLSLWKPIINRLNIIELLQ